MTTRKPGFAPNTSVEWIGVVLEGTKIMAMAGKDLQVGLAGFGDTVPKALRHLAERMEKENWRSIITLGDPSGLRLVPRGKPQGKE